MMGSVVWKNIYFQIKAKVLEIFKGDYEGRIINFKRELPAIMEVK